MAVETLSDGRAGGLAGAQVRSRLVSRVRAALAALGRRRSSVALLLTDDRGIRELNARHRNLRRATDVLSFPLEALLGETDPAGDGVALGDIVMSVETALRRAGAKRLEAELLRLAIHGLCHLFGHDHQRPREAKAMFALERRLLRAIGQQERARG